VEDAVTGRLGFCLLLVASMLLIPPAAARAEPPGSITWTVDHHKKTITAAVQLYLFSACSGFEGNSLHPLTAACSGGRGKVTQELADRIKGQIESIWNNGYHYKCYRLIVVANVKVGSDAQHIDADRIGVRIDPSAVAIRSYVEGHSTTNWSSNDPADRVDPYNGGSFGGSIWDDTPYAPTSTWAHEFGHILGLSDYYEEKTGLPKPGAPIDLMTVSGLTSISQESIDRVVERNRDRLFEADGTKVNLEDLVCEPRFMATFKAGQIEYIASNLQDSIVDPPCSRAAVTHSTSQEVNVESQKVEIRVVDAPEVQPMGYLLVASFDVLLAASGLSGGGRPNVAVGMFDLPITVAVTRDNNTPAKGAVPAVLDIPFKECPGGDGSRGSPPPRDCGARSYPAWLAMALQGTEDVWPVQSSVPKILKDLGYSSTRLDRLYKNCSGPSPWPGAFADVDGATQILGRLPPLATLQQVASDWAVDGTPGRVEINGSAEVQSNEPGTLIAQKLEWTLTLCPLDAKNNTPPACP
jgi:hypothetical protein